MAVMKPQQTNITRAQCLYCGTSFTCTHQRECIKCGCSFTRTIETIFITIKQTK
jgi:hypothetical protein